MIQPYRVIFKNLAATPKSIMAIWKWKYDWKKGPKVYFRYCSFCLSLYYDLVMCIWPSIMPLFLEKISFQILEFNCFPWQLRAQWHVVYIFYDFVDFSSNFVIPIEKSRFSYQGFFMRLLIEEHLILFNAMLFILRYFLFQYLVFHCFLMYIFLSNVYHMSNWIYAAIIKLHEQYDYLY